MPSKDEILAAEKAISKYMDDNWERNFTLADMYIAGARAAEKVRRKAFLAGKVGRAYHIEVKVPLTVRRAKKGGKRGH